jgi:hypothetical protein
MRAARPNPYVTGSLHEFGAYTEHLAAALAA